MIEAIFLAENTLNSFSREGCKIFYWAELKLILENIHLLAYKLRICISDEFLL